LPLTGQLGFLPNQWEMLGMETNGSIYFY